MNGVHRHQLDSHVLDDGATYAFRLHDAPDAEARVRMAEMYGGRVLIVNVDGRVVTHHGAANDFKVEVVR